MSNGSVAIIGGEGFLGQALIRSALEKKIEFLSFDLKPSADSRSGNFFRQLDITKKFASRPFSNCSAVINLTGQVSTPLENCLALNSIGLMNLLNSLEPGQKFLQISTVAVYGSCEEAKESSALNPETPYGAAKAAAEKLISAFLDPASYAILRVPNLFGPMQRKGVLAYLLRARQESKELQFDNDGSLLRYYLHVDDAAALIWDVQKRGLLGVFNMPGEGPYDIRQLIGLAEECLNVRYHTSFTERLPPDTIRKLDFSKLRNEIAFSLPGTIKRYLKGE